MSRIIPAPIIGDNASSGAQIIDGSLKFQKANSTYLIRTPSSAGNRSVYTGSVWVKRTQFAPENNSNSNTHNHILFSAGTNTANNIDNIRFYKNAGSDSNAIEYGAYPGSYNYLVITNAKFRDPSGWYNVVWNYDGTTAKIYINGVQQTDLDTNTQNGGSNGHFNNTVAHVIGRTPDLQYNGEFDGYMSQFYWIDGLSLGPGYFGYVDPLTNTWRPKKFRAEGTTVNDGRVFSSTGTFSNWDDDGSYPKTELFDGTLYTGGTPNGATSDTTGEATFDFGDQRITGFQNLQINIFLSSNQASATNVVSVNGVDITNECHQAGNNTWTTVDLGNKFTSLQSFRIANYYIYVGGFIIDGVVMQDNTTTNLDFGTNGFYLPFDGNSPIGQDKSGKGNDSTPVNFNGTDSNPDVVKDSPSGPAFGGPPTSGITTTSFPASNYCTLNPLDKRSNVTLSNGNLDVTTTNSHWSGVKGTLGVNSGKYYFEEIADGSGAGTMFCGICASNVLIDPSNYVQDNTTERSKGMLIFCDDGKYQLDTNSRTNYSSSMTDGDVLGVAFDLDGNTVEFYKNGNPLGSIDISSSPLAATTVVPLHVHYYSNTTHQLNFGQKPFKYAPPEGFSALNSNSVRPETVITRPDQFVGVKAYTGDGSTNRLIEFPGRFAPDLVFIKRRNSSNNPTMTDSVRGVQKNLRTSTDGQETTDSNSLDGFRSTGFIVGSDSAFNGGDMVAWGWKAGGNKGVFNVDDKGYANASDVGMNVGGQNSNAYNQSTLWRNSTTTTDIATNTGNDINSVFDGRLDTGTRGANSGDTGILQWTSGTISGRVRVHTYVSGSPGALTYFNGGTQLSVSSPSSNGFNDLGIIDLTELRFGYPSGGNVLFVDAIELDGKILVDSDVTPPNAPSIAASGASVGTKQGFSIVKWTRGSGTDTIPHGLSQAPDMIIQKSTSASKRWQVGFNVLGWDRRLYLNLTDADSDSSSFGWSGNYGPTDTVLRTGGTSYVDGDMIAYCWHNVPGLQKFGSYTGNGSTDGTFIELGFRPAVLITKRTDSADYWYIFDTARDVDNVVEAKLEINTNAAEHTSTDWLDILSNGFKLRSTGGDVNTSGGSYIYAAWAEQPAFNLFGGQSNAR